MTDAQRYHGNLNIGNANIRYRFSIGAKRLMNDLAGPSSQSLCDWHSAFGKELGTIGTYPDMEFQFVS